ncbi:putative transcription factor C2H2 family [Lupinus albus]|uniref:Putative transcription factor C2H2 family n=1 Tax=Lupinus albus TaxID=3870 RepID=A0A6A4NG66_LUPAL|nr:putative transcription factor C2H2 family [Lupinus albus]
MLYAPTSNMNITCFFHLPHPYLNSLKSLNIHLNPMQSPNSLIPLFQNNHDPDPNPFNRVSLHNLSILKTRLDSLHHFLSHSINTHTLLTNHQLTSVSNDIVSSIHQLIVNAAALISFEAILPDPPEAPVTKENGKRKVMMDFKFQVHEENDVEDFHGGGDGGDCEIVELDAVELLAEHTHFCEICGKGFRRDANLRMHMRAHGDRFKTPEALAKPLPTENGGSVSSTRRRGVATQFSCPFEGCNRNKGNKKFKALKSIVCVKNHFKRSHCPKLYSCNRCHKKNFSVLSDLKSHMKQCGEYSKWKCSCGTTFSRKDKLFGHIALFEGHMPVLAVDDVEKGKKSAISVGVDEDPMLINDSEFIELGNCFVNDYDDDRFFDDLDKLDSFTSLDLPSI